MKNFITLIIVLLIILMVGCAQVEESNSTIDISVSETVSEKKTLTDIDKTALENWGDFETVSSLYTRLGRNLENPDYVIVNLKNVVVIRSGDIDVRNSLTDNITALSMECLLKSNAVLKDGEYVPSVEKNDMIDVIMKDDTKNRVVHGDIVNISGVLDTADKKILDAEYEMITPNE